MFYFNTEALAKWIQTSEVNKITEKQAWENTDKSKFVPQSLFDKTHTATSRGYHG